VADNLNVTPGTGATIGTKDVSGVHHPKALVEGLSPFTLAPVPLLSAPVDDQSTTAGQALQTIPRRYVLDVAFATIPTAQTYADDDVIGGVKTSTFSAGTFAEMNGPWMIDSLSMIDLTGTGPDLDVFVFGGITVASVSDGGAFAPTGSELNDLFIDDTSAVVQIAAADWIAAGSDKLVQKTVNKPITSVYGTFSLIVVNRSGSDYIAAGTSDLQARLHTYPL
jgi:hypothetical protein